MGVLMAAKKKRRVFHGGPELAEKQSRLLYVSPKGGERNGSLKSSNKRTTQMRGK